MGRQRIPEWARNLWEKRIKPPLERWEHLAGLRDLAQSIWGLRWLLWFIPSGIVLSAAAALILYLLGIIEAHWVVLFGTLTLIVAVPSIWISRPWRSMRTSHHIPLAGDLHTSGSLSTTALKASPPKVTPILDPEVAKDLAFLEGRSNADIAKESVRSARKYVEKVREKRTSPDESDEAAEAKPRKSNARSEAPSTGYKASCEKFSSSLVRLTLSCPAASPLTSAISSLTESPSVECVVNAPDGQTFRLERPKPPPAALFQSPNPIELFFPRDFDDAAPIEGEYAVEWREKVVDLFPTLTLTLGGVQYRSLARMAFQFP